MAKSNRHSKVQLIFFWIKPSNIVVRNSARNFQFPTLILVSRKKIKFWLQIRKRQKNTNFMYWTVLYHYSRYFWEISFSRGHIECSSSFSHITSQSRKKLKKKLIFAFRFYFRKFIRLSGNRFSVQFQSQIPDNIKL